MDDFLIRAALVGVIIMCAAGPIGCFIVWRRMAYFGDTMAHTALLGATFGLVIGVAPTIGVLFTCFGLAILLYLLQKQKHFAVDTLLGILAHGNLAVGIILVSLLEYLRLDLLGYLFGDILSVANDDIIFTLFGALLILGLLIAIWKPLVALTVSEPLARAEGLPVERVRIIYMLLVAAIIALAVQLIGMLLITALLIIPAAASRKFSRSPEMMAVFAILIGALSVIFGLFASYHWDAPSGPAIVLSSCIIFICSLPFGFQSRVK